MGVKDAVSIYIREELKRGNARETIIKKTRKKFPKKSPAEIRGKLNTCLFMYELSERGKV